MTVFAEELNIKDPYDELIQDFDEAQKKYSEIKVVLTKSRPRLPLVKAPTSNPPHSNDPTDMDEDLPPIKYQSYPWVPEINIPPKLIHASPGNQACLTQMR
ncbi:13484_t:CDS:2 [Entrophospora sp. SA101]|nr:13484_t:CDS:2 [Entrophospora sp. SA101]